MTQRNKHLAGWSPAVGTRGRPDLRHDAVEPNQRGANFKPLVFTGGSFYLLAARYRSHYFGSEADMKAELWRGMRPATDERE
jgi:hypothetical protein